MAPFAVEARNGGPERLCLVAAQLRRQALHVELRVNHLAIPMSGAFRYEDSQLVEAGHVPSHLVSVAEFTLFRTEHQGLGD